MDLVWPSVILTNNLATSSNAALVYCRGFALPAIASNGCK